MKVQAVNQQNYPIQKNKQPSFKGVSGALNFFATNLGWGANLTDVAFMVCPRTAKDTMSRGINAGIETGFRESMGTTNDAAIGLYGVGAGALLGGAISSQYKVKANKIFTSPERVEALAKFWDEHLVQNTTQEEYLKKIIDNINGYNTSRAERGYVRIPEENKKQIVKILDKVINDKDLDMNKWRSKCTERSAVTALITEATGAENRFKIGEGSTSSLNILVDDIVGMSKAFKNKEVIEAFNAAHQSGTNKFLQAMSKFNKGRALLGFLVGAVFGLSVQPLNMWYSKKRTGCDGFVGVEGRERDRSLMFKMEKLAVAAAMFSMVLASLKCKPKDFLNKMAFQGKSPTINQLKGIYGVTVTGRILVTRDKDEMRESAVKDSCGFLSWLVLGDFVNRGTAAAFMGKKLLNFNKDIDGNIITSSTLKSRNEVLREALSSCGISTVKTNAKDGSHKAMNITEMIKVLETSPLTESIRKATKKKLRVLNIAQLAGYAFTGIALGVGIPTLNIYMTNKSEAKRKARVAAEKAKQADIQQKTMQIEAPKKEIKLQKVNSAA